ncbi:winged helix-turn-helix transcriptional regulator [Mesobacillus selenatarsenatis]|uniref:Transcriptional regulator, HxlR family n=1 Tax=Mesobacillus selenatarsenatis (strain DSM 18680 / JCM 14380 / FERM P-15431 / SF-1) TaxID=1321606 RepID=A0A0A8WX32_MESS1|nr:winged helix-turn-helix transcriptional regulator [Mesobacillus selenatarsenatis]GAM12220.1 transcriptional regulator, HxlR family [Mesobacillus selenatarsenatis SF-1]
MGINFKKYYRMGLQRTPFYKVGGKWKLIILWHPGFEGTYRYNELRRLLPGITHKMLSQQLKELEQEGLIERKQYIEMPPKVEYSISEMGLSLKPLLEEMHKWGREHGN